MVGINIWTITKKDVNTYDRDIILNLNIWNHSTHNKNYLDIGIMCNKGIDGLLVSLPMRISESSIIDLHPEIKKNPSLLNLIFKNTTDYRSTNASDNAAFTFALSEQTDTQLLSLKENYRIDAKDQYTLLYIDLKNKKKEARLKNIYIRFRIELKNIDMFYKKLSQFGLADYISNVKCFDIRINDPRNIAPILSDVNSFVRSCTCPTGKKRSSTEYKNDLSMLKEVHIITIDNISHHPIYYGDDYVLTPRVLEDKWEEYIKIDTKKNNYLTHHFRFKPKTPVESSICFAKFESQTLNIFGALVIAFLLGLLTEWLAEPLLNDIFVKIPCIGNNRYLIAVTVVIIVLFYILVINIRNKIFK